MAKRGVKREPLATMNIGTDEAAAAAAAVPAEKQASKRRRDVDNRTVDRPCDGAESNQQAAMERRVLRSRYLAVKNLINDEKDDLCRPDSDKFKNIIEEVDKLHKQVQKPREQVADAEALLDIANTLVTSVRSQSKEGIMPSDFITCLIRDFGETARSGSEENRVSIKWMGIGLSVSSVFKKAHGCSTMIGPMNVELKQRKAAPHRKRAKMTECASRPESLDDTGEAKTDTDKNMTTIFNILTKPEVKCCKLENLILNRKSFGQTVENLFALSFLAKDGRIEITVDEKGTHIVYPRNSASANSVASGEAVYSHFVFKFDFKDWKVMMDNVPMGEELMPHREELVMPSQV